MRRILYRLLTAGTACLLIVVAGVLTPNARVVSAQGTSGGCTTKTQYSNEDLTFSPDNKYLIAPWDLNNGISKVWDVETGKVIQTLTDNNGALGSYAFSSDSRYVLTSSIMVNLWDLQTGQKVYELDSDGEPYGEGRPKIVISPDNKYFVLTSDFGTRIYNFKTGKQLQRFLTHSPVLATFSRDSRYILMQEPDTLGIGGVVLWDIQANQRSRPFGSHVIYASYTDDGRHIATITTTDTVKEKYTQWDVTTHQVVRSLDIGINIAEAMFSPNGNYFVVDIYDGNSTLWDAEKGLPLHIFSHALPFFFTPNSRYLLMAGIGNDRPEHPVYQLWDIKLNQAKPDISFDVWGSIVGISPNSKYLATGLPEGELRLWDLETGQRLPFSC